MRNGHWEECLELCHFDHRTEPQYPLSRRLDRTDIQSGQLGQEKDVFNNNNNIYLLQLGCHPVAVVILHVNKHEIGYY